MSLRDETPMTVLAKMFEARMRRESGSALGNLQIPDPDDELPAPRAGTPSDLDYESLVHLTRGVPARTLQIFEVQMTTWASHETRVRRMDDEGNPTFESVAVGPSDEMVARALELDVGDVRSLKRDGLSTIQENLNRARRVRHDSSIL